MTTAERDAAVAEALERAAQLVPDAWLGASGTREAIRALKPRSDLPQCHPTWTECQLCHNDIKRMPEGCQFKPRSDMVSVPRYLLKVEQPSVDMLTDFGKGCVQGRNELRAALLSAAGAKE